MSDDVPGIMPLPGRLSSSRREFPRSASQTTSQKLLEQSAYQMRTSMRLLKAFEASKLHRRRFVTTAGLALVAASQSGFGRSSKPATGYNYDTFAADLDALLNTLNLTNVSLVGHSMGTGEIARYIGKYGTKRLRKAALIGTLGPYLVKAPDNPEGVDPQVFNDTRAGLKVDRPAALMEFLKNFYSVGGADGKRVSERVIEANWVVGIGASPIGTVACIDAWIEDFRKDIARNDLPTMIIHGDDDRILPPDATSRRQAKMIKNVKYVEIKGGSHGLTWTRADEVNAELVRFLA